MHAALYIGTYVQVLGDYGSDSIDQEVPTPVFATVELKRMYLTTIEVRTTWALLFGKNNKQTWSCFIFRPSR